MVSNLKYQSESAFEPTLEQLSCFDKAVPRYTSYPTAPEWGPVDASFYQRHLNLLGDNEKAIALYFHIPFCKTMCLYCACSVVLNRKSEVEDLYVKYLLKEIDLVATFLGKKKQVAQIHFGGGTPTKLTEAHFCSIIEHLRKKFEIQQDAEIAIEIDPRTVSEDNAEKLIALRRLGFNRVSFGVQDLDPKVQDAVRRRQSYEMTRATFEKARELNFKSINIDLIYGLPYQTEESFRKTVEAISLLLPDRIALFSYAKVPWLKPHQKAIDDSLLPSTEEKFRIYLMARKAFITHGYQAIGMDHFAQKDDELSLSYHKKTLHRNFQGYTVLPVDDLIGMGVTGIGHVQGAFFQNIKELQAYYHAIDERRLPVARGKSLSPDDTIRRWVIQKIMCNFQVDKNEFIAQWGIPFDTYFHKESAALGNLQELVRTDENTLVATPLGELFVRLIAAHFDVYFNRSQGHKLFSKAV